MAVTYPISERRTTKPSVTLGVLCVLGIAAIAYATMCPIELRPRLASADLERFGAYYCLGGLIGLFVPRRWPTAVAFVVFLAFGLEVGQVFVPGRDAVPADALVKAFGGAAGVVSACGSFKLRRLIAPERTPASASAA